MRFYDTLPARATGLVLGNYLCCPVSADNALQILRDIEKSVGAGEEINYPMLPIWDEIPACEVLDLIYHDIRVLQLELRHVYQMARLDACEQE